MALSRLEQNILSGIRPRDLVHAQADDVVAGMLRASPSTEALRGQLADFVSACEVLYDAGPLPWNDVSRIPNTHDRCVYHTLSEIIRDREESEKPAQQQQYRSGECSFRDDLLT